MDSNDVDIFVNLIMRLDKIQWQRLVLVINRLFDNETVKLVNKVRLTNEKSIKSMIDLELNDKVTPP